MGSDDEVAEDRGYLRRVYGIDDPSEIREYYDTWAKTYDDELAANGYASPRRVAEALASLAADLDAAVLDYGCGTGMSGESLAAAGFSMIDGADPAAEMLAVAKSKDVYRSLVHLDLDAGRPPFDSRSYAGVAAVGLIGPGAAPLGLFDQLMDLVAPGGLFGVSFNDHALTDPAYRAKIAGYVDSGAFNLAFEEHGPHLPALDVDATVFVLKRVATS